MNEVLKKSKYFTLRGRICLFTIFLILTSCFPIIQESRVPPINKNLLINYFHNDKERILVLPLWIKYPVIESEESIYESSTLSFDTPLFLKVKNIEEIHNLIPSKTSVGLVIGPSGGIATGEFFYGLYIISESGRIIFLKPAHQKAKLKYAGFISEEEKKELIRTFRESKEIFPSRAYIMWFFTKGMKLKINYDSSCRNDIINFINSINLNS